MTQEHRGKVTTVDECGVSGECDMCLAVLW